jgi:hypothetical protein
VTTAATCSSSKGLFDLAIDSSKNLYAISTDSSRLTAKQVVKFTYNTVTNSYSDCSTIFTISDQPLTYTGCAMNSVSFSSFFIKKVYILDSQVYFTLQVQRTFTETHGLFKITGATTYENVGGTYKPYDSSDIDSYALADGSTANPTCSAVSLSQSKY